MKKPARGGLALVSLAKGYGIRDERLRGAVIPEVGDMWKTDCMEKL